MSYFNKTKDVGKIFKTTDGLFNNKPKIKKPRNVAVIEQRKDDGAVGVVKIYSQENKSGKAYIESLVLTPDKHKALKENSIVGSQIILGIKIKEGEFKALYPMDFTDTGDKLSKKELKTVKNNIQNDTVQHRKTHTKKVQSWKKHFKDK